MKDTFVSRMRKAMDLRNMKQTDIVEKTGLGKSAISQYYSGKYEPKQRGIYLIAKALDVNEAWLMGYDVPMERNYTRYPDTEIKSENTIDTIAAHYDGVELTPEERREIENYIQFILSKRNRD